jgi:trk system potassium uptake protein TrkA
MRVIIVGAGEVGSKVASNLVENHEVVVIDRDPDRTEELTYSLDVLAKQGNGKSLETLEDAGLEDADLLVASTDVDDTNLTVCGTAKAAGDPFTIARVRDPELLGTWERSRTAFGVDFMVCSTLLTADEAAQVARIPLSLNADRFVHGLVQMAEFEIVEESPMAGKRVSQADEIEKLTFAAVIRDGEVLIPSGETTLRAGDKVVVIGSPEGVSEFALTATPAETPTGTDEVFVVGANEIGVQVARRLRERGSDVRLIEQDEERANRAAERLPDTVVLNNDATDTEFLEREHFGRADAVIAALENDQKNLLVSLLADRFGVGRTVSVIESEEYRDLFRAVGVSVAINPQIVTGEEIARFTREQIAEELSFVEGSDAEVFEIEVGEESVLAGRPLAESTSDLLDGVVVGAIVRGERIVTPRGDTTVEVGDHVILFADGAVSEEVASIV